MQPNDREDRPAGPPSREGGPAPGGGGAGGLPDLVIDDAGTFSLPVRDAEEFLTYLELHRVPCGPSEPDRPADRGRFRVRLEHPTDAAHAQELYRAWAQGRKARP